MGNPLRDRRTPQELAASGQVIEFEEKIAQFERLAAIVQGDLATLDADKIPGDWRDASVSGRLSFGFADALNGLPKLEARIAATIDAVCQRCLGALQLPLEIDLRLLFGAETSNIADDSGFEVWELDEDRLRPLDVVEEALIMALPLAATHSDSDACKSPDEPPVVANEEKTRPFASLKAQMDKEN